MSERKPGWYAPGNSMSTTAHLLSDKVYAHREAAAVCGAHVDLDAERPHWRRCKACLTAVEKLHELAMSPPPPPTVKTYTVVVTRPASDEDAEPFVRMLERKFRANTRIEIVVSDFNDSSAPKISAIAPRKTTQRRRRT